MRRLTALAALILIGSTAISLAQGPKLKTVGLLCHCSSSSPFFREAGLAELGWRDGKTVRLVRHTSDGDAARLRGQAEELVALRPDVIFAGFTPAAVAIQGRTSDIPVVFAGVSDPIELGATHQISRPDRNFTGLTTMNRELMPKRLELLQAALPNLKSVGYLANPNYALHQTQLEEIKAAAHRFGLRLVTVETTDAAGIDRAFARLADEQVGAVLVQQDPLFTGQPGQILALAEANRLPAMYPLRSYYDAGGLMWYGGDVVGQFHDAASYIDRILKGAKPNELPIERPSKLQLTINLGLAARIGIEINPAFIARADEVSD